MKAGHVISSCLVGTVLGTVVVAGRFQQAGPSQPSFRSIVNLILVDMRVAAGANQIADLRIDEIALLVDGARRPIVSLDYHPTTLSPASREAGSSRLADAPRSNAAGGTSTRRVAIVVDRDSIESGEGRQVEKRAHTFIERLPPLFTVAVTSLPIRNGIRFEPKREDAQRALAGAFAGTTRRGPGLEGISGYGCTEPAASSGCGDQGLPRQIDVAKAREMSMAAELRVRGGAILDDLLWLFRSLEDGPSDVVLVSGGFPVERATAYVEDVQRLLPGIVVEEQYVQVITRWSGEALKVAQAPVLESHRDESDLSSRGVLRRRQLVSDVLLIQMAGKAWVGYRDVAEVDGKPVRDRAVRLQKLFMSSRAGDRRQMQRIADESARLNLGPRRNINTPTFPLWILTAQNVSRFAWALARPDPAAPCCAVVDFREVTSPTIVSTDEKRDVPLSGRFWLEPGTGRVRQALLTFAERREHVNGWFNVHYGPLLDFDVLVPVSMGEWSTTPDPDWRGQSAFIAGRATYSNVRRFTVHAEETMK